MLPGCADRPIDVNAFNGTLPELEAWWGAELPEAPVDRLDILWEAHPELW